MEGRKEGRRESAVGNEVVCEEEERRRSNLKEAEERNKGKGKMLRAMEEARLSR